MNSIDLALKLRSQLSASELDSLELKLKEELSWKLFPEYRTLTKKLFPKIFTIISDECNKIEGNHSRRVGTSETFKCFWTEAHTVCPTCGSKIPSRLLYCDRRCSSNDEETKWVTLEKRKATSRLNWGADHYMRTSEGRQIISDSFEANYGDGIKSLSQIPGVIDTKRRKQVAKTGVDWHTKLPKVKAKAAATNIEVYGGHPQSNPIVRAKTKATNLARYDVEHPGQIESGKLKRVLTSRRVYGSDHPKQHPLVQAKFESTSLRKHGFTNHLMSPVVQAKVKATLLETTGYDNPLKNPETVKQVRATSIRKYGKDWASKDQGIQDKIMQTRVREWGATSWHGSEAGKAQSMAKHGYENPMQSPIVQEKALKSSRSYKPTLDSYGNIVALQGYEPRVINKLMASGYKATKNTITLPYQGLAKRRVYLPDLICKKNNQISLIEVKSIFTLHGKDFKANLNKFKSANQFCRRVGYNFVLIVFHGKSFHPIKFPTLRKISGLLVRLGVKLQPQV